MVINFEPLMPHEDDDEDQPELIPPDNPPASPPESPTRIVRGLIIRDLPKLMPSTQTSSSSLRGNDNGETIFPREDADKGSSQGNEESSAPADQADPWEVTGSILCGLASDDRYAGFMVENHVLEIILANLNVSKSARITETCLQMLGNLACHEDVMGSIVSTEGLIRAVVQQLFLDDVLCLCEAFRLLTIGLEGSECIAWVKALLPARIIKHLVWIMKNTSNEMLLLEGVGLFLTILRSQQGVVSVLIPSLIGQGLPKLLVSLVVDETRKLYGDLIPERCDPILNAILLAIKALPVMEDQSCWISFNKELIQVICNLVKHPNKVEVCEARMTAAVLLANALADDPRLAIDMSRDVHLFRGLLNTSPRTLKDAEAVWNILSHLLVHIKEREIGASSLLQYVSVLLDKSDVIKDILLDSCPPSGHQSAPTSQSSNATVTALSRIISILKEWTGSNGNGKQSDEEEEYNANDRAVRSLTECCERHLKDMIG